VQGKKQETDVLMCAKLLRDEFKKNSSIFYFKRQTCIHSLLIKSVFSCNNELFTLSFRTLFSGPIKI